MIQSELKCPQARRLFAGLVALNQKQATTSEGILNRPCGQVPELPMPRWLVLTERHYAFNEPPCLESPGAC